MGRIMLATSNNTDEEYGGTYVAQASEVAYDNSSSKLTATNVQDAITEAAGRKTVWTGNLYTANDEFTIPNFSVNKKYVFFFRGFSSTQIEQFIVIPITYMQFIVQGDSTQYRRYRINAKDGLLNGTFKIVDIYGTGDSGTALIQIDEI